MAIWHFKFSLVPASGVMKHHGQIVDTLSQYVASEKNGQAMNEAEFLNYWDDGGVPEGILSSFSLLLPHMDSWDPEAFMYGSDEGDNISVWKDDIFCSVDIRNFDLKFLESLLDIANRYKCKIVLNNGKLIDPDINRVISEIKKSIAYRFCIDPEKAFESIK